jgi:hypothetical protein
MCTHDQLVESRGEIVCTRCGLVLRDDDIPAAWFRSACDEGVTVSRTMQRQVELIAYSMRLPDTVASTAGVLATTSGFRSSNVNALAACLYIAAKRHALDRLEREFLVTVPGLENRLFLKYIKLLKTSESGRTGRSVSTVCGLETLRRLVPRVASDMEPDPRARAGLAQRLDGLLVELYPVYADAITPMGIFRIALQRLRADHN